MVSESGKEATITLLAPGDFIGEDSVAAIPGLRLATATASTACTALRITRDEMVRVMHAEHGFSDLFLKYLVARGMRTQADLVEQLFNSSEKRLARILLLMAEFGQPGEPEPYPQDLPGDAGGDDRHHALARQLLHEPLPQAGIHRVQRAHPRTQVAAERDPTRPAQQAKRDQRFSCGDRSKAI